MNNQKALRQLRLLLIEAALFFCCLIIVPRLNFEGILYRAAGPVDLEEVLAKQEGQSGSAVCYAGYPGLKPTPGIGSEADLQKHFIAVLEVDASQLEATGIYKQTGHRPVIRSSVKKFWLKPYADYAQYYLLTFEDGSRTWALIDDAITKIPRKGPVTLPIGYYWDEGASRFLTDRERERYQITDSVYMGNCIDLYSGWMDGDEMADFSKRFSFLQSVALVVLGLVLFVNLIMFSPEAVPAAVPTRSPGKSARTYSPRRTAPRCGGCS